MSKLYILLLLLLGPSVHAQVTITETYFPEAGDTLKYNVAAGDVDVDLLTPGPNRQWNFGTLESTRELNLAASSAATDTVFTDADIAVDIDTATVGYYRIADNAFELVGLRGTTPLLQGYTVEANISPARIERYAPLNYGDSYSATTTNTIVVNPRDLPQEVRDELGSQLDGVDSIRVTNVSGRVDEVDAYGTLTLNGRTYDVLREARAERLTTTVDVLVDVLGTPTYVPITDGLRITVPELAPFLGEQDVITTYYFWAQDTKEAIATITQDSEGNTTRMTFIRGDATNSVGAPYLRQANINVYPNPARGLTTFSVIGLDAGEYTISVLNVLGRKVAGRTFSPVSGQAEVPLELGQLPRGTYLYSLTNQRGRILATRRLVVGG